ELRPVHLLDDIEAARFEKHRLRETRDLHARRDEADVVRVAPALESREVLRGRARLDHTDMRNLPDREAEDLGIPGHGVVVQLERRRLQALDGHIEAHSRMSLRAGSVAAATLGASLRERVRTT